MRPWPLLALPLWSLALAAPPPDAFTEPKVLLGSAFCRAARCSLERTSHERGHTVWLYRLDALAGVLHVSSGGRGGPSLNAVLNLPDSKAEPDVLARQLAGRRLGQLAPCGRSPETAVSGVNPAYASVNRINEGQRFRSVTGRTSELVCAVFPGAPNFTTVTIGISAL